MQIADFPLLQRARASWAARQVDLALELFEQAVAAQPENVRAIIEAARALGQSYQIDRAEALLQRARSLAGDSPTVAPQIAQTYRLLHRIDLAIEALSQLRTAQGLPPPLLGELAVLYEQTNQLDAARDTIRECIAEAPGQAEPLLVLARIERVRGEFAAARALLEPLSRRAEFPALMRVRVWTELGYLHDAVGEYDQAVVAIEHAKQILRGGVEVERLLNRTATINDSFRRLYATLDAQTMEDWRRSVLPFEQQKVRVAHLLGFPRSGTTLIEQILDAHPQLISSSERSVFAKEIFPVMLRSDGSESLALDTLRSISDEQLAILRQRYLDCLQAILRTDLTGRVHMDKNPNHTSLIAGLFRLFPESKFLFAVRDPRDAIVSTYLRFFPLTEFSASFLSWEGTCRQYAHEMDVWLSVREKLGENALEIRYEDVIEHHRPEITRALEFLGLEWHDAVADYRKKIESKLIVSPSQAAVRQPIHRNAVGRWKNYHRYMEPYLEVLDPYRREFGYT